ncbi:FHA domain-containing protein, partial [Tsukamurella columbiensis]
GPPAGRPQGVQPPQGQPQQPRPAAPAPTGGAPIQLRFDDGHSVDVRGDGIIGREPVVPATADPAKVTKHVLVDDTASVSKTHLLFGITRGELWVEDVGSTNGSAIAFGDSWTELTKGVRYAVEKGSVVHMGQRSFKVFGG